jgi:hypothetical protein
MSSDPRDYKLDISGLKPSEPKAGDSGARPFVSVLFNCCRVYQRIYRNAAGDAYEGRCPRCMRAIRFVVGPGGTNDRSFVVD